jgi:NAD+ kinase
LEDDVRVLLVPNTEKEAALAAAAELADWLDQEGHEAVLLEIDAAACGLDACAVGPGEVGRPDLAVALGGDGTIIKAVHILGEVDTPLLGVNLGRLGFLSGAGASDTIAAVSAALGGEARVEKRAMLQLTVECDGRETGPFHALNEVVVGRLVAGRVVELAVRADGHDLTRYTGDGVIVATSTGSTAYALSAGGPIVTPDVACMLIVPVAAHTLARRAMVLSLDSEVELTCPNERRAEACVTIDGERVPCDQPFERVRVWRGDREVSLLKLDGTVFLDVVREKFLEG